MDGMPLTVHSGTKMAASRFVEDGTVDRYCLCLRLISKRVSSSWRFVSRGMYGVCHSIISWVEINDVDVTDVADDGSSVRG